MVSGSKITMASPKLSGFTRDGRNTIAGAPRRQTSPPDIVEMEDISAKFEAQDKTQLDLTALQGHFDRKTAADLAPRRALVSSNGYRVNLEEVRVDTGTSTVISETPVQVHMLQGTLNSKRMEVLQSGDILIFDGGVKLFLNMNQQTTPAGKPTQP